MKTTQATATSRAAVAPSASAASLRRPVHGTAIKTRPPQLQETLAQLKHLRRALESTQQQAYAAQQQVDILREANAQLKALAVRCGNDVARGAPKGSVWKLTDFCLFAESNLEATPYVDRLLITHIRFPKGTVLYRAGDAFDALFAIRIGSCKTVLLARDGHEQIVGYHIAGEIIGFDGISNDVHSCQAIALEDMEVCRLPFDQIENLAQLSEPFAHNLHKSLSQEGARAHAQMIVLGTMRAEQRLVAFLLDLSQRYHARGYSSCEFVLQMKRSEIGNYLGLTVETVSRLFSRFQREGMIQVEGRVVKLLDRTAMGQLIDGGA